MRRIRASAMALIIAATTLLYAYVLYKPSDYEHLSELPTAQADVLAPPTSDVNPKYAVVTKPIAPIVVAKTADKPATGNVKPTQKEAETILVEATFYTANCEGCSGITTSRYDVRRTIKYEGMRIIAMSKDIPLYTIVNVELADGSEFKAIVLDRGGAIKSGRIDVLVKTKKEAYRLGRQQATVTILKLGGR